MPLLDNTWDTVLAGASTSAGGLGKLAALGASETVYVRCDCSDKCYEYVDWLLNTSAKVDVGFYVARSIEDEVTLTLASFTDADTIVLNGCTITGESTANTAAYASRKFSTAGGTDTLDAAALAALINADYAVVTAGTSVAGTDKLLITTDDGLHTLTARASADLTLGEYTLNATAATEATNIIAAINHSQNVTCASSTTGDTVTVNGYVFTSAAAEDLAAREFDNDSSDADTATSLAACINDATYGVPGITAVASGATVYLYREAQSYSIALSSSDGDTLACVTTVGGVPGVIAAATGVAGELSITPTWSKVCTVTEAGARLTVTDIDIPGVYASAAEAVVTLTPGTPAGTAGELATVIQATAPARCTVSQAATLAGLRLINGTSGADMGDNHLTGGTIYSIPVLGYPYAYVGVFADGTTPTVIVSASKRR